ncbi:hypothetical protein IW261DRAFT_1423113 [Armillaria novae-zelandiae]|uniref:Uncharacterized protein n=1 Tax=Armillaria novae-zelandiae TaxID=153914 RepID=A0AA39U9I5_9AGAR|nr:hypothetical protein IW261DRAFT_1423113 [Armillaria novae-zelandiae]
MYIGTWRRQTLPSLSESLASKARLMCHVQSKEAVTAVIDSLDDVSTMQTTGKEDELTVVDVELDGVIVVEIKVKIKINKQNRMGSDGGHETETIQVKVVDEEACNGGSPTDDVLDNERTVI